MNRRHTDWMPAWRRAIQRDLHNASMWLDRYLFRIVWLLFGIAVGLALSTCEPGSPAFALKTLISSAAVRG